MQCVDTLQQDFELLSPLRKAPGDLLRVDRFAVLVAKTDLLINQVHDGGRQFPEFGMPIEKMLGPAPLPLREDSAISSTRRCTNSSWPPSSAVDGGGRAAGTGSVCVDGTAQYSGDLFGGSGPTAQGEITGEIAQDAPDTARVQAGALGQFRHGQALSFEVQQFLVLRRAKGQHFVPKLLGLKQFRSMRLLATRHLASVQARQPLFFLEGHSVFAKTIVKAVACRLNEECLKARDIGKLPGAAR